MLIKRLKIIPFLTLITAVTTAAQTKDVTHYKLEDVPRFEVGAQFSSITVRDPSPISGQSNSESHTEAGIGARFTYNFTGLVAAEAELTFFPHDNDNFNDYTAGRAVQGLFGVKIGKRFERFGLFGKACPGFIVPNTLVETMRFQRKTFSCYTLLLRGRSRARDRQPTQRAHQHAPDSAHRLGHEVPLPRARRRHQSALPGLARANL